MLLLFIGISVFSQNAIITVNPAQINQSVTFGGDAKLTIKAWAEGNTNVVSQKLFGDMNLKILRVPIFALQPISDPIYDNVITVINSVKAVNPNVKIFASVANGDGYGANHHGADKFPADWKGCCPYNIYSLNLTTYATYLDSFVDRMAVANIFIDYLGPWNEDQADDSDHFKAFNQMTLLGTTKKVGLERWGLQTSINDVDDVEDQTDIIGSHFFDDMDGSNPIPEENWTSTWASLVSASEDPVWYTESTRYGTSDGIDKLIAGLDNIFPSMRGGVEVVSFYQVCKRFVWANGGVQPIKYSGFQNIVNNAEGNVVPSTSDNSNIKLVAFANGSIVDLHILNKNVSDITVNLQLLNSFLASGTVNRKIWTPTSTAQLNSYNLSDISSWNITAPATSYSHLKIPLNMSVLGVADEHIQEMEFKIYPNPVKNGNFTIKLPQLKNVEDVTIKMFSINGKEVYSDVRNYTNTIVIDKILPNGMYFISIRADGNRLNSKIFFID